MVVFVRMFFVLMIVMVIMLMIVFVMVLVNLMLVSVFMHVFIFFDTMDSNVRVGAFDTALDALFEFICNIGNAQ